MSPLSRSARSQAGQTLPLVVIFMMAIIGLAGMVIDLGNLERCRAQMQVAADAAATAGANQLIQSSPADAHAGEDTAREYGMSSAGKNTVAGIDTQTVSEQITTACDTTYSACSTDTGPNTVTVHEEADVPTFFLGMFGFRSFRVGVDAEACGPCGTATEHDIMLVLDRTGSMQATAEASNHQTKIMNLKSALVNGLLPTLSSRDRVGMTVFPPDTASSALCDYKDPNSTDSIRGFYLDPTADYLALPMSDGFLDGTGGLNQNSDLIRDINCLGPFGTTDYLDPLRSPPTELLDQGRPGADKVIIMISDGAANQVADPACLGHYPQLPPIYECANPCKAGIDAANSAKDDGIQIYAIAYGGFADDAALCTYSAGYQGDPDSDIYDPIWGSGGRNRS